MCGDLAERRLDEALVTSPVTDGSIAHQHVADFLNGMYVDEDLKDHEIVHYLQTKQKSSEII